MVAHRPSEFWNGLQARLPDAFWMSKQKGEHTIAAVCEVWTHPSGWELRLIIGGAYARPQILAIDEIGYLSYDAHAADLLFQVISRRYEQRSIVVTTNLLFKQWDTVFPNASCAVALIDRLTHHAEIIPIGGESYRKREAELAQKKRRAAP